MSSSHSFLSMQQVAFGYPDSPLTVSDIDWQLPAGEFHCLLGRSGCGKSTLLKLAAGLLLPDRGHISLEGRPVTGPDPVTGFVFQAPTLLEWLTVIDNVLLPVSLRHTPTRHDISHATALLDELGLSGLLHRYPHQLSGGQQSRVAIARALLTRPRLLLMDEPFAALDALTREELQAMLRAICHQHGTSVLFVTHDLSEAVYLADRVAVMETGRIVFEQDIPLGHARPSEIRYSQPFNRLCARLREVMMAPPARTPQTSEPQP